MFCDPLDFRQFTTVIKSLNPTGPTSIVSVPSNGGHISSTFAQRPLAAAVAQTGPQASRAPQQRYYTACTITSCKLTGKA
jgi:hypothetical protein